MNWDDDPDEGYGFHSIEEFEEWEQEWGYSEARKESSMADQITVWVNAYPEQADFGLTTITIPENDEDRAEYLETCEKFFKDKNRPADADKFHQAVRQT